MFNPGVLGEQAEMPDALRRIIRGKRDQRRSGRASPRGGVIGKAMRAQENQDLPDEALKLKRTV